MVTHGQLAALGYSNDAIKHRVRRGRLHPVHRGVYAVGRAELSREGEWTAALLRCGWDDSALSHDTAAAVWKLTKNESREPIHVATRGRSRSGNGLVVHRATELNATTTDGLRVTTPAQTLIDLARIWPTTRVEAAIAEADLRRVVSIQHLQKSASNGGRNAAALRAIIGKATFRVTQSELEREFLRLVQQAGLPVPETQHRFGRTRADFYWHNATSWSKPTEAAPIEQRSSRRRTDRGTRCT